MGRLLPPCVHVVRSLCAFEVFMSVSTERIPLSKRERFAIFDRDQFVCRYCGKSPPSVRLVVDHVIPVSRGGTNATENLITSCQECNQGKGPRPLSDGLSTIELRKASQEHAERVEHAKACIKAQKADERLRQSICNHYCSVTGNSQIRRQNLTCLLNVVNEFGFELFSGWMYRAQTRIPYPKEDSIVRYVCGCAKHHRQQVSQ